MKKSLALAGTFLGLSLVTTACTAGMSLPNPSATSTTTTATSAPSTSATSTRTLTTSTRIVTFTPTRSVSTGAPAPTKDGFIEGKGYRYAVPAGYEVQANTDTDDTFVRNKKTGDEIYTRILNAPPTITDPCQARDARRRGYEEKGHNVFTEQPINFSGTTSCALSFVEIDSKTSKPMVSTEYYILKDDKIYVYALWGTVADEPTRVKVATDTAATWVWK